MTPKQTEILQRSGISKILTSGEAIKLIPLFGGSEHRSAQSLEKAGKGNICSSFDAHPNTEWFFQPKGE